eukprot:6743359-Prymnesium_polylepis.1
MWSRRGGGETQWSEREARATADAQILDLLVYDFGVSPAQPTRISAASRSRVENQVGSEYSFA